MTTPAHTPSPRTRGFLPESRDAFLLFGFALLVLLFLPAPCPAADAKENAPAHDRAALRAEAEDMLLPNRPNGLLPAPDIWKLRCGSMPAEKKPSYYGTLIPSPEYEGCYNDASFNSMKILEYSPAEILRFDPSTIPYPIITEPSFTLTEKEQKRPPELINLLLMQYAPGHPDWQMADFHLPTMIRKARMGNPMAALKLAARRSYLDYFWLRIADTLTRPGWGFEKLHPERVDGDTRGLLGWPEKMYAMGGRFLDERIKNPVPGDPDYKEIYRAQWKECALRGHNFVWSCWIPMYMHNTAGVSLPNGILDKAYPTRAYAMALAGSLLPPIELGDPLDTALYRDWAGNIEREAPQNGVDVAYGKALAKELCAVYMEHFLRLLERQRRHRAEVLPEVNRQIDAWLKDMEVKDPKWLKKAWPDYPNMEAVPPYSPVAKF